MYDFNRNDGIISHSMWTETRRRQCRGICRWKHYHVYCIKRRRVCRCNQRVSPAFEEEHNVTIDVQELSEEDLHTSVALNATSAEGAYDLVMVDGSWMAEYTEAGVLANLSDLGYELDDDIIEATTSICYVDDSVYLAPYYGNVTVLMMNKANVEEAGYTVDSVDSLKRFLISVNRQKQMVRTDSFIVETIRTTW